MGIFGLENILQSICIVGPLHTVVERIMQRMISWQRERDSEAKMLHFIRTLDQMISKRTVSLKLDPYYQVRSFIFCIRLNSGALKGYGRSKECDDKVEAAVRAHQNNNQTVDYALAHSRLLKMLILHGLSMEDAVSNLLAEESSLCEEVKESTRKGWCERESARLDKNGWDEHLVEYGKRLSEELYVTAKEKNPETKEYMRPIMALTCSFPQSYFCALKIVGDTLKSFEDQEDIDVFKDEAFAFAVNRNINFGGDTCGRSFLIGTLMVALGADIPLNWVKLAKNTDLILKVTHMLEEKNSME